MTADRRRDPEPVPRGGAGASTAAPRAGDPAPAPSGRTALVVLGGTVLAGAAAGALAKLADLLPGGDVSAVASSLAVWILLLALIARWSTGPARAALASAAFFIAMVVGYYSTAALGLGYAVIGRLALAWGGAALLVCPVVAAVLQRAFRSGRLVAAVPVGLVAGSVFVDGALRRVLLALQQPDLAPSARPLAAGIELLAALLIVVVLPRTRRVRLGAAAIAVVVALALVPLLDRLAYGSGLFA